MTPATIETAARRKYNSDSSSFYSSAEVYDLIYQAELEIAVETKTIEVVNTSLSTVVGQRAYVIPSTVLDLKRVEVNGQTLQRIDFREDDVLTLNNSSTTEQGEPLYYSEWSGNIYLRPIPVEASLEIKIYGYGLPAAVVSAAQTLEVPTAFHMYIVDRVAAEFAYKDENLSRGDRLMALWNDTYMPRMKRWARNKRTGDAFGVVKTEENLTGAAIGRL